MGISFIQALMCGILYYLITSTWVMGLSFYVTMRPLVTGMLVGLVMGNVTKGIEVGIVDSHNYRTPHFNLVVDEIGENLVSHVQLQLLGHVLGNYDFAIVGSILAIGNTPGHKIIFKIPPVVILVDSTVHNALEIIIGLKYGWLLGNQAHAFNAGLERRVAQHGIEHVVSVDGRVVVVDAKARIGNLEMRI